MREDIIRNMRGRIAKCRRLAAVVMDDKANRALLEMAAEIERDILRLEAGAGDKTSEGTSA